MCEAGIDAEDAAGVVMCFVQLASQRRAMHASGNATLAKPCFASPLRGAADG